GFDSPLRLERSRIDQKVAPAREPLSDQLRSRAGEHIDGAIASASSSSFSHPAQADSTPTHGVSSGGWTPRRRSPTSYGLGRGGCAQLPEGVLVLLREETVDSGRGLMRRAVFVVFSIVCLMLTSAGTAGATKPVTQRGSSVLDLHFPAGTVCPFTLDVHQESKVRFTTFVDG